jgi:beta-galactosidase GanA
MTSEWILEAPTTGITTGAYTAQPGQFFSGTFQVNSLGDAYLDMNGWPKGCVWVNGHHLGRYWEVGPQKRLFLPANFLKKGKNDIVIFDLTRTEAGFITSKTSLE